MAEAMVAVIEEELGWEKAVAVRGSVVKVVETMVVAEKGTAKAHLGLLAGAREEVGRG